MSCEYRLTRTRHLHHAGHDCVPPEKLAVPIASLRDAVVQEVHTALVSGWHGTESLRRFLATPHGLELRRVTFGDLVQRI